MTFRDKIIAGFTIVLIIAIGIMLYILPPVSQSTIDEINSVVVHPRCYFMPLMPDIMCGGSSRRK